MCRVEWYNNGWGGVLAVAVTAVWLALCGQARAGLLAYEGFDYGTATTLAGSGGSGIGFGGNSWTGTGTLSGDDTSLSFAGASFTQPGNVVGARYAKPATPGSTLEAQRNFSGFNINFDQPGTYYVSALVKKNNAAEPGTGGNFATVALGGFNVNAEFEMTLGSDGTFNVGAKNDRDPSNTTDLYQAGETYFLVGKVITSGTVDDQFFLNVYGGTPSDSFPNFVGGEPTIWHDTHSVDVTGTASSLNVRAGENAWVEIDEIRIGTTWGSVIPEPSTALMLLLGLAGLAAVRTRVRRLR